jgi:hypothetical protein
MVSNSLARRKNENKERTQSEREMTWKTHARGETLKLGDPVGKSGERDDDQVRSVAYVAGSHVAHVSDHLDGLSEPHLVGKDAARAGSVQLLKEKKKSIGMSNQAT